MNPRKRLKRIMPWLSFTLGLVAFLSGMAGLSLAGQDDPMLPLSAPGVASNDANTATVLTLVMTSFTGAIGALGAFVGPVLRDWLATQRYKWRLASGVRALHAYAVAAKSLCPTLPPIPPVPPEWLVDDEPTPANEVKQ